MYQSRAQARPQGDTGGYHTPPRHIIFHPRTAIPGRHAQYLVSPPWRNEYANQAFEDIQPVFSNVDLATDVNTLMNRDIPPPAWATIDDHYHERRGVPPARRLATPSDAVRRMRISMSRSTSITGTPEPSRGSNYYSRYRYQIPHHTISEMEDDSEDDSENYSEEDEAREPANTAQYHSRPWSDRQAPATAAASRHPLKGLKRVLHKLLSKLRRSRSSGRLPPTPTYLPTAPVHAAPTSAFTVGPIPWNAYDDTQYYTHGELNTGASILERTHTTIHVHVAHGQHHPLTVATEQAAARVQRAMETGNSELDLLMRGMSRTRQVHDWQDGVVMDLVRR